MWNVKECLEYLRISKTFLELTLCDRSHFVHFVHEERGTNDAEQESASSFHDTASRFGAKVVSPVSLTFTKSTDSSSAKLLCHGTQPMPRPGGAPSFALGG